MSIRRYIILKIIYNLRNFITFSLQIDILAKCSAENEAIREKQYTVKREYLVLFYKKNPELVPLTLIKSYK